MATGKTAKRAAVPGRPFQAAAFLRDKSEIAAHVEAMLEDGGARVVPIALRTACQQASNFDQQPASKIDQGLGA